GLVNEDKAGTRAREVRKEIPLLTLGRRGGAPHQAANGGLFSGRFFAPAKPAFPPSMAVAASRISRHAVTAKPAQRAGVQPARLKTASAQHWCRGHGPLPQAQWAGNSDGKVIGTQATGQPQAVITTTPAGWQ